MFMVINYVGFNLEDDWVFMDISILLGVILRCELLENVKIYFSVICLYFNEMFKFIEWFDVWEIKVGYFKIMIIEKIGLYVSVFCFVFLEGKEMYDCYLLKKYFVNYGDMICLEIWNGWGVFLKFVMLG